MRDATAVSRVPLLRAALVGCGLAAAWVVVSLVTGPSSASADENPSGLLGTVGSVVGVVDDTVDSVVGEVVEPVVTVVTAPLATTVEVAESVAPAPVQPVVGAVPIVVDTATDAAGETVDAVDALATDAVAGIGDAVGEFAGSAPVGSLANPLVGAVDGVAGSLPLLGPVLGDDTLGGLLGPVVGAVDDTVGAVVGELGPLPDSGILPSLPDLGLGAEAPDAVAPIPWAPAPGDTGDPAADARSGAPPGSAESTRNTDWPSDSGPPGAATTLGALAPGTGGFTAFTGAPLGTSAPGGSASGSGGSATSDAAFAAHDLDALASLVLHTVDDALPSSPVYDTDTTPD